jgi:hypothetical protein
MRRLIFTLLFAASTLSIAAIAGAADPSESADLRNRVQKLTVKKSKLSKRKLKRFYAVNYRDSLVSDARHQCYLALVDQVNLRKENKGRLKNLKFSSKELKKLRKGYGKMAGMSAEQVEACELRRTPECEKLLQLGDDHKTRYYRSEIDIMKDEVRGIEEAIDAHRKMADRALQQCQQMLNSLG